MTIETQTEAPPVAVFSGAKTNMILTVNFERAKRKAGQKHHQSHIVSSKHWAVEFNQQL